MYVNPTLNDDNYEQYIIPIVSSPKAVKGYSTRSAFLDKILILDKSNHSDMPQMTSQKENQLLLHADSLMAEYPDSALIFLESIPRIKTNKIVMK